MNNKELRELDRYHLDGLWNVYEGYSKLEDEKDSGGEFVLLKDVEELLSIPKHETVKQWVTINNEFSYPEGNQLCLYESELGAKFLGYLKNGLWYQISDQNPIGKHFNIVRFMKYPESTHHGNPEAKE